MRFKAHFSGCVCISKAHDCSYSVLRLNYADAFCICLLVAELLILPFSKAFGQGCVLLGKEGRQVCENGIRVNP